MRSKILVITTLLLCYFTSIYAQVVSYGDTVYMKNNIKIPCKILETSFSEITILFGDSTVTKIRTENIDNFKFADFKTYKKIKRAEYSCYSNNTVFFEAFGNGLYGSINYDRVVYRKNNFATSIRIGFTQYINGGLLPIELNLCWKARNPACFTELGFGYTPLFWADYHMSAVVFRIGFRYQQPKGGLFFRAGFLPIYQFPEIYSNERFGFGVGSDFGSLVPWYGVSIGYTIPR